MAENYETFQQRRALEKENTYLGAVRERVSELADKVRPSKSTTADTMRGRKAQLDAAEDAATGQQGQADRAQYNWTNK